jgi:spore coat protein CotF
MKQTKQNKTNTAILNIEQHGPNRKQGLIQVLGKSKQFHLTVKEYMSAFSLAHNIR